MYNSNSTMKGSRASNTASGRSGRRFIRRMGAPPGATTHLCRENCCTGSVWTFLSSSVLHGDRNAGTAWKIVLRSSLVSRAFIPPCNPSGGEAGDSRTSHCVGSRNPSHPDAVRGVPEQTRCAAFRQDIAGSMPAGQGGITRYRSRCCNVRRTVRVQGEHFCTAIRQRHAATPPARPGSVAWRQRSGRGRPRSGPSPFPAADTGRRASAQRPGQCHRGQNTCPCWPA